MEALEVCQDVDTTRGAVLARVDTDVGVSGWGELPGGLRMAETVLESTIRPTLVGEPVWNVERFLRSASSAGYARDHLPIVGGIEMALWDALGKDAGVPVHQLLGGKCVESVPIAFCLGLLTPDDSAENRSRHAITGFGVENEGQPVLEDGRRARHGDARSGGR